jgi:signal transduction histidine kinase/iron only hydrogenase large subunit-like protein
MGIVTTIPEKCKRCYTCVRECPAKAIKVEGGQATVIEERCIACGNCVKVCAQAAKSIENSIPEVRGMLSSGRRVVACLAPSFPAAFHPLSPGQLIGALKTLGFSEVWEVALGAELISTAYVELFKKAIRTDVSIISTPCPAIVSYVQKYMPELHGALAPIVSPMIATAAALRSRGGNRRQDLRVVFIGPCIAKKNEIREHSVDGMVDAVLTFKELGRLLEETGTDPRTVRLQGSAESDFDNPPCNRGRSFPISGGLLKTAGLSADILENNILITEGKDRVLPVLRELAEGRSKARFFDVLFCEGCINGPKIGNEMSVFARKQIIADYVNERSRTVTEKECLQTLEEFKGVPLGRSFSFETVKLPEPGEEAIRQALDRMHKLNPEDQLNCGACGYPTCMDKAVAVCQGLAEPQMCLPYLVEELEVSVEMIKRSNEELLSAQQKLVESERLASMGQISAGVAHEINNPLGTIILYSHLLMKQLEKEIEVQPDLQMIVKEATRCKNIVRGLLDFGRQSRVSKAPTDLRQLVEEASEIMEAKAAGAGVRVRCDVPEDLPVMMIDQTQIKQMLVNLIQNGVDAVAGSGRSEGEVGIRARPNASGLIDGSQAVEIAVSDTGCGIPKENIPKLFTPFFSTKESAKGTGLGLAICYGIVKMHSGNIAVDSAVGAGTTFTILLPVGSRGEEPGAAGDGNKGIGMNGNGEGFVG